MNTFLELLNSFNVRINLLSEREETILFKAGRIKEKLVTEDYAFDRNIFFSQMFSEKEKELWMIKKYLFL